MSKQLTIELSDKVYQDLSDKFQEDNPNISLQSEIDDLVVDWIARTATNTAKNYAKQKVLEEFENQYIGE